MAKTNISFNNKNYSIDDTSLSSAADALKSHLSAVMSGSGAVINLGGTAYNVDSAKLSAATNAFVSHLGTIAGNGYKVVVGGVEYGVDSAKMTGAVAEIEAVLGGLHTDDDGSKSYTAGLYETGAIALYNEQGAEAIEGMMIKSWDELVSSGAIVINDGVVSVEFVLPDNLPEKNEYGFYFDVSYEGVIFHEDGSCHMGENVIPAGTIVYGANSIDMSALGGGVAQVSDDGFTLIFENFTARLGEYPNLDGDLFMPNSDNITEIGNEAFSGQYNLTNITIPEGVVSISESAFCDCSNLMSITIPSSVTTIGDNAFGRCDNLMSIDIPDGVTSIGDNAFSWCSNLTNITIPSSVTTISPRLVMGCTKLTSIDIPEGVTTIGESAFYYCNNLMSIDIPDGVISIGDSAFSKCSNLTSVNIPDSVISIGNYAFRYCGLTSVTVPEGVTTIGDGAFHDCSSLTSITIPSSVTTISIQLVMNCTNLTNITFGGTIEQWKAFTLPSNWNHNTPATYVQCSDGTVALTEK